MVVHDRTRLIGRLPLFILNSLIFFNYLQITPVSIRDLAACAVDAYFIALRPSVGVH